MSKSMKLLAKTTTPPPLNLTPPCKNAVIFIVLRSIQIKIRILSGWKEKRDSPEKRILRHSFLLYFPNLYMRHGVLLLSYHIRIESYSNEPVSNSLNWNCGAISLGKVLLKKNFIHISMCTTDSTKIDLHWALLRVYDLVLGFGRYL